MSYPRLPRPDKMGNYWLGQIRTPADPAIFPSKEILKECVVHNGTWLAFLGSVRGFIYQGPTLKHYTSPEEALAAINEALDKAPMVSGKY